MVCSKLLQSAKIQFFLEKSPIFRQKADFFVILAEKFAVRHAHRPIWNSKGMAEHNDFGKEGELRAQAYLRDKGYTLLDCNWRSGKNELDIVAEKDGMLVVVEVKSRSTEFFEHPKDAITPAKIRRTVLAAHDYILAHNLDMEVRFDVVGVVPHGMDYAIEHIEDAFLPPVN